jgi:hypothetical protein
VSDYVTVLYGQGPVNKQFMTEDGTPGGKPRKCAGMPQSEWKAVTRYVPDLDFMEALLSEIGDKHEAAIVLGYIKGTEKGTPFKILSQKELALKLDLPEGTKPPAGLHEIDSEWHATRTKINFLPSSWILFDYDLKESVPENLNFKKVRTWVDALKKTLTGLDSAGLLLSKSASSRGPINGGGFHAFLQIKDPADLNRFRSQLRALLLIKGMGVMVDTHNRETGEVTGQKIPWLILDTSVLSPSRLVFEGKPFGWNGLKIKPAAFVRLDGGRLDTGLTQVTEDQLQGLHEQLGVKYCFKTGEARILNETNDQALQLDTILNTEIGKMTVKEYWNSDHEHTRCQAPFRDSESQAAFISRHEDGVPFVFDSCGPTKYTLSREQQAQRSGPTQKLEDFYAYAPNHRFVHVPTREFWPGSSVDSRLSGPPGKDKKTTRATLWLDQNRSVEQITWAPGLPELIEDKVIQDGGWLEEPGNKCFNLYRPPIIEHGDPDKAGPWVDHVRTVYPDEADHLLDWFAYRVQHPDIKINHGLVLGGESGIGKDTMLEPVKHAVGPWNFKESSPSTVMRRFNSFLRAVILRVNEARDLGDVDRYGFYDHMKNYMAAPPDALEIDEKNIREHYIPNLVGVIITTNYKGTGLFLPPDDRRHFVAWSPLRENPFDEDYWNNLWGWYESGGYEHVAAYLANRDVSLFNPKARPPQTPAFFYMVDANRSPEDAELADLLDQMKNPDVVTLAMLREHGELNPAPHFGAWLDDRKNRRQIPHRMEEAGYDVFRNSGAKDGLWKIGSRRQSVYINKASNLTVSQVNKRITTMIEKAKPMKRSR